MDYWSLIITCIVSVVSLTIGAIITWLVSRHYYRLAAVGLQKEAAELRKLTTMILRALEESGQVRLNRDAYGEIVGLTIELKGAASGRTTASGHLSVDKGMLHGSDAGGH